MILHSIENLIFAEMLFYDSISGSQSLVDTVVGTSGKSNFFAELFKQFSGIISLIAALMSIIGGPPLIKWIKSRKKRIRPVVTTESFKASLVKEKAKYFIPNHVSVGPADTKEDSIRYLIRHVLLEEESCRFHFIEAPTGIGKTTYMVNLFLETVKQTGNQPFYQDSTGLGRSRWLGSKWRKLITIFIPRGNKPNIILASYKDLTSSSQSLLQNYLEHQQAGNTILLIDALDEYSPNGHLEEDGYWSSFRNDWDMLSNKLVQFRKVVISVREQFLEKRNAVQGNTIAGKSFCRIKLLPFNKQQAAQYVTQRYAENRIVDFVKFINDKEETDGLFCIPLILSRTDEIMASYDDIEKNKFSKHSIYEAIIKGWLQREVEARNIAEIDQHNIRVFCQYVAFKIGSSDAPAGRITEDELREMNYSSRFDQVFGHRERTLLKREEREITDHEGFTSRMNYYEFAHRSFLEFFLAELALRDAKYERQIPFDRYGFAAEMFIAERWKARKSTAPKAGPQDFFPDGLDDLRVPARHFLYRWSDFFAALTCSPSIRAMLQSVSSGQGLYLLEKKPAHSLPEFQDLLRIQINTDNFWDVNECGPDPVVSQCIPYIKSFVVSIDLNDLSLTDDQLACFEDADKLEDVSLLENQLDGSCLACFSHSKYSLIILNLAYNKIDDDEKFAPLNGANRIDLLGLSGNQLDGSCMAYFSHSKHSLTILGLSHNRISDDEKFAPLGGANKIQVLSLLGNQLDGSCVSYFSASKHSLTELKLGNNRISDDEKLAPLDGADCLERLDLGGNELNGSCLAYFSHSKHSLTYLDLSDNAICDDGKLAPLSGVDKLVELHLQGNQLDGSCITYFSASKHSLTRLNLGNNRIRDDEQLASLEGADKLQALSLQGNQLDGSCISYFSASKHSLIFLDLSDNRISEDIKLAPLAGADLQGLFLAGNSLDGSCVSYFSHSEHLMTDLDPSDGSNGDEQLVPSNDGS